MPDVAEAQNLEWIILLGCVQLQKLNPSIGSLKKLVLLNLTYCEKLVILSNTILGLNSLKYLYVRGCSIIGSNCLLDETRNTKHLISYLSPSCPLSCLCELNLSYCNLLQIPDYIGKLHCLQSLNLEGNNFVTLPNFKDLLRLYFLNLQNCKRLKYLPDLPSRTVLPSEPFTSRFPSSILKSHLTSLKFTGLMIFGCPELVEIEQLTTKSFSWTIQIIEATYQLPFPETYMPDSIMPGSQIPSLFNNEFVNGDIENLEEYLGEEYLTVDPPPVPHDNNFIGVLCCIIFCLYNIEQIPMNFGRDHMWLHYEELNMDRSRIYPCVTRIIELLGTYSSTVYVKKFQYRWVNEQDLINLKMTHCANLTAGKRKISVIEENG
ncbi:disease resistance protein RML1B-like [Vigna radiata var. radiata]|uniref:Disease resistance protein RML1B-like n=1 Tax=Vigna radiata var. radiata TaxID=3916 RepID=A0A3Q0F3C1_VIGRR|nr:disease resistance protein RML1B-like [Vigna radiata var. radiata]